MNLNVIAGSTATCSDTFPDRSNFTIIGITTTPILFSQCIGRPTTVSAGATALRCSRSPTSRPRIFKALTILASYIAKLQCSGVAGGYDRITIENIDLENIAVDPPVKGTKYSCSNVNNPIGFSC